MSPQRTLSGRAWAELLLLATIWGGSFLSIRIVLDEVGVLTSVAHRVLWAALVLWLVALLRRKPLPGVQHWPAFLVMGLLNNVIPFGLIFWGQLHIETGLAAILNSSTALFGILVAALVFRDERLTLRKLVGLGIGLAGVATAVGAGHLTTLDLRSAAQLAILGASMSYALAAAWARSRLTGLTPEVAAAGMLTGSTLVMLPLALLVEGPPRLDLSRTTWAGIGYYTLAATAFAYLLYYRVFASAGSGNTMLATLIVAPIAILIGAVVLGESLPPQALAGLLLVVLGLAVIDGRLLRRLAPRPAPHPD